MMSWRVKEGEEPSHTTSLLMVRWNVWNGAGHRNSCKGISAVAHNIYLVKYLFKEYHRTLIIIMIIKHVLVRLVHHLVEG